MAAGSGMSPAYWLGGTRPSAPATLGVAGGHRNTGPIGRIGIAESTVTRGVSRTGAGMDTTIAIVWGVKRARDSEIAACEMCVGPTGRGECGRENGASQCCPQNELPPSHPSSPEAVLWIAYRGDCSAGGGSSPVCREVQGSGAASHVARRLTDREEVPDPGASGGRGQHRGQPVAGRQVLTRATVLPSTIHAIIRQLPDGTTTLERSARVDVSQSRPFGQRTAVSRLPSYAKKASGGGAIYDVGTHVGVEKWQKDQRLQ